jgi:hypothetical protein
MLALGPTSERPKADATITCVCLWERFWLRRDCLFPPTVAQIVFSACCGAAKQGIVQGNTGAATTGRINGSLCCKSQTIIGKQSTQCRRDDVFPVLRIVSCPPMADAVVVLTIFQQHFPSMVTMECDGEGDPGVVCMFDARPFRFPLFVNFSSPLEV